MWSERINPKGRVFYSRGLERSWLPPDSPDGDTLPVVASSWHVACEEGRGYIQHAESGESAWVEASAFAAAVESEEGADEPLRQELLEASLAGEVRALQAGGDASALTPAGGPLIGVFVADAFVGAGGALVNAGTAVVGAAASWSLGSLSALGESLANAREAIPSVEPIDIEAVVDRTAESGEQLVNALFRRFSSSATDADAARAAAVDPRTVTSDAPHL